MSQRLLDTTKWLWCLLVLNSCPIWNPVRCVAVRTPPSHPSTIETQAKFFQYRHFPSAEDYEQGHRLGSDRHFTERHERARPSTGLFSAKIRWGDKKGGYGEHYWDLNHAGHTGDHGSDHGDDDGSYHERDSGDSYDEPSDQSSNYDNAKYDLENTEQHEDSGREKRTPKRIRIERVQETDESDEKEKPQVMRKSPRKRARKDVQNKDNEEQENENQEVYSNPAKIEHRRPQKQQYETEENKATKEKNQMVLVVDEKEKQETPVQQYVPRNPEAKVFVPYEDGAGIRQHYPSEIAPAASVPRLFLEPATGHVIDRATGQAYVLQPINRNPIYS